MRNVWVVLMGMVMVGCAAKQEPPYQLTKLGEGLKFPEGPAWDGKGNIFVSNCDAKPGMISKFDETGNMSMAFEGSPKTFQSTNGMTMHVSGSIFACDFTKKAIVE